MVAGGRTRDRKAARRTRPRSGREQDSSQESTTTDTLLWTSDDIGREAEAGHFSWWAIRNLLSAFCRYFALSRSINNNPTPSEALLFSAARIYLPQEQVRYSKRYAGPFSILPIYRTFLPAAWMSSMPSRNFCRRQRTRLPPPQGTGTHRFVVLRADRATHNSAGPAGHAHHSSCSSRTAFGALWPIKITAMATSSEPFTGQHHFNAISAIFARR